MLALSSELVRQRTRDTVLNKFGRGNDLGILQKFIACLNQLNAPSASPHMDILLELL
jgi:hypothetical protein